MILLHIITKTEGEANKISDFLIDEKLILSSILSKNITFKKKEDGEIISDERVLIQAKTKSLLFPHIDDLLRSTLPEMPELYALPITHMDWEQTEYLVKETNKV